MVLISYDFSLAQKRWGEKTALKYFSVKFTG